MSHPPVWTCGSKGSTCRGCAFESSPCLLRGRYNPHARITLVCQAPTEEEAEKGSYFGSDNFKIIEETLRKVIGDAATAAYNVVYLVGAGHKNAPKKDVIERCSKYMNNKLHQARKQFEHENPDSDAVHVLMPLGAAAATHFVSGSRKLKDVRGNQYNIKLAGYDWVVAPTYSPKQLFYQPGYARVIMTDVLRAWRTAYNKTEEQDDTDYTAHYIYPETAEEVGKVCDEIIAYYDPNKPTSADDWPISIDIETNTLQAYREDALVLSIGIAWDDGLSTCIMLDHPRMPAEYDKEAAWKHLARVLSSPKPKILHNARFDIQFLAHRMGLEINNLWYDTLLGEHFLDEDKKGEYGLKGLTGFYLPKYVGYEKKLQEVYLTASVTKQDPDKEVSWEVETFFPTLEYESVSGYADWLEFDDRAKLFDLEALYLKAAFEDDAKVKSASRSKIRAMCAKLMLEAPDTVKEKDFTSAKDQGFLHIPIDVLRPYTAVDADVTRQICKLQQRAVRRAEKDYPEIREDYVRVMRDIYIPATWSLSRMEYNGAPVDVEALEKRRFEAVVLRDAALAKIRELVCQPLFNPNSNPQLSDVVLNALDISRQDCVYTDLGELSVTKEWLSTMQKKYETAMEGEFMYCLLLYRTTNKTISTVFSKLLDLANVDGKIHTSFNLNGTATGRLSSARPNLQNIQAYAARLKGHESYAIKTDGIPVKAAFIPPQDGKRYAYYQMDISAAEIRVLCAYAPDEGLIKAMTDPDMDIHSFIASTIFDIPYAEFVARKDIDPDIKHKRTATKRVVFGTIYGAGPRKIAEQIYEGLSSDPVIQAEQVSFAYDVISALMRRFPAIQTYIDSTHDEVNTKGWTKTLMGRYRRFRLGSSSGQLRSRNERMAVNFKIQSTASDIVLSQLCEIESNLHKIGGKAILTVHDSVAGYIEVERVPEMRAFFDHYVVDRVRERFPWLPVPFSYDLEVGSTYGDLIPYSTLEHGIDGVNDKDRHKVQQIMEATGLSFFEDTP